MYHLQSLPSFFQFSCHLTLMCSLQGKTGTSLFSFLLILPQQVNEIVLHMIPNENVKSSKPRKGETSVPDHRAICCIIKENKMFHNTKEFSFMGGIIVFLILHMPCCNWHSSRHLTDHNKFLLYLKISQNWNRGIYDSFKVIAWPYKKWYIC